MDEVNEREQRLAQLEAMFANEEFKQEAIERLSDLLDRWNDTRKRPDVAGMLSSEEYAALVLASGQEDLLPSPLSSFLALDGWLQRWVLQTRGFSSHVGTRIGTWAGR